MNTIFLILKLLCLLTLLLSVISMFICMYQEHRFNADLKSGLPVDQWRFPNVKWFKFAFMGISMSLCVFGGIYILERFYI